MQHNDFFGIFKALWTVLFKIQYKQCFDLEIKQELDTSTCFHVSDTPTSFNHVIQNGVFGEKQYFVLLECLSFSHQISRAGIKLCRRSSSLLLTRFYSPPLTALSEEEQMMKDTGQCYWPHPFHVPFLFCSCSGKICEREGQTACARNGSRLPNEQRHHTRNV